MWVIGNWKMHKTASQAQIYMNDLLKGLQDSGVSLEDGHHLGLAVPFTAIAPCAQSCESIEIGAQNMHDAAQGAFTGEIGSEMLQEAGARFVLLGHSERRHIFGESEEFIARKVQRALEASSMSVVLCVGETLQQHQEGQAQEVVIRQIKTALEGIATNKFKRLRVAYEPVWAIGTGKVALDKDITQMHEAIRTCLKSMALEEGQGVPILYGGSVQASMVPNLVKIREIDGFLVGGASLDAPSLIEIAKVCFTTHR